MTHKTIIGIDLTKHLFQVSIVNYKGTLKTNTTVTRGKLLAFMAHQPPALVVMEACSGAHDWARRFRAEDARPRGLRQVKQTSRVIKRRCAGGKADRDTP